MTHATIQRHTTRAHDLPHKHEIHATNLRHTLVSTLGPVRLSRRKHTHNTQKRTRDTWHATYSREAEMVSTVSYDTMVKFPSQSNKGKSSHSPLLDVAAVAVAPPACSPLSVVGWTYSCASWPRLPLMSPFE